MFQIVFACIVAIYIPMLGGLFAWPAFTTVKYSIPLFLLNALVCAPILNLLNELTEFFNLGSIMDLGSSLPELAGDILFFALLPVVPALVVFLLIRLCAKRYAAAFGLVRLFGTLVCSSTLGLIISFCVMEFFFPSPY